MASVCTVSFGACLVRITRVDANGNVIAGANSYVSDKLVSVGPQRFVAADACSLVPNASITPQPTTRTLAMLALRVYVLTHPADSGRYTIAPALAA